MRMRGAGGVLLVAAVLAGCAGPVAQPGATYERIGDELKRAGASVAKPADSKAVSDALLPPLQVELPKATAEAVEPRFDLAVSSAPAAQVFMAIVSGTRYSMLVPPDISGNISVNLKNVTVGEALEAIRDLYGYDYRVTGTRILVQSNSLQSRVFKVNYLAGRRQGTSELRVTGNSIMTAGAGNATTSGTSSTATSPTGTAGSNRVSTDSSRVVMASDADFWGELRATLNVIVGSAEGRSVVVNPISGVVVVRGLPADLRNVENFLKATQLIIERQVMLEAKIIEVALNDEYQSGVNWTQFGRKAARGALDSRYAFGVVQPGTTLDGNGALTTDSVDATLGVGGSIAASGLGKGFFGFALQTGNFAALLNFLETQGGVQVLSSPRLATLNNQKAVLKVGTDEFFVTNVSSSTTLTAAGSTTSPTITLEPFFSGIALDVTPQIDEQGQIILHIHPSISVVAEKQKQVNLGQVGTFALPVATSTINETDSIVRVKDSQIVAIGGLMKQEQSADSNQLPGLGELPLLGNLFSSKTRLVRKRELVILLKPTVIHGEETWAKDLLETQGRLQEIDPRRLPGAAAVP